ncbi:hypothetical protein PtrSN002B_008719 [Pyrenophora tritici-repentis]|uniref:Uncharacterized protein n=2 Tax=Pyrenophora tritici-repentis TaxID=45151 RepID=A0A2W1FYX3_9PLEO|nr:uncharacterized protein PTRG_00222 [Pyrenophora tritici-repentis Pt-1C-BFP]KAA8624810.1 hypothetical protein PtrV1_00490 [Pyrenophora tritici-repentis]EDU39660.1 predicted protein [Pyrenophora tritici-repentis Pt-1C-BFP]KAF7453206.1 hypothetical protein A1F99_004640 [Pyrenophora tritici-repentis]KAF7576266.1 hypothetical protein PtrM4_005060 [Pyrenophora tritici-repentis]KAG9377337.1 hypothetical protein A1F94_011740 [Pyrenophora tritici-repentis]
MSPISRLARLLLIFHALVNMALGAYPFFNPAEYSAITGVEAPERALQDIGLGTIAIGWYQLIFTLQGNRKMMASTIPLRCAFAGLMYLLERPQPLLIYELVVVWFSGIAVFA